MIKKIKHIVYLTNILLIVSCTSTSQPSLPNVSGSAGEVVVVMGEANWQGEIGETIRDIFLRDYSILPQPEPAFDLIHIPPNAFNNIFRQNRNIIMLNIESSIQSAEINIQNNVWAQPQLVIRLNSPTKEGIVEQLNEKADMLFNLLESTERKRIYQAFKKNLNIDARKELEENHHISLPIPHNFNLDVDSPNFVWLSNETPEISQGILLYHYPYTDTATFSRNFLINKRNQFLQKYVPGPVEGSYMTTELDYHISFEEYSLRDERYIAVLRGLWKVQNAFMGGPFMSITTLDEQRNRVVTMEGYVYAPRKDKRNLLRQLEAILFNFDLQDKKPSENE